MRIGIATGLAVVGDLVGEGEAQERGIVGETPNLAARLQGLAEPGTMAIAAATRRLLGDRFRCGRSTGTSSRALPSRSRPGRSKESPVSRAGSNWCAPAG